MSTAQFIVEAEARNTTGTSAARRLRKTSRVPGIIYGGNKDPINISVDHDALMHQLDNEAFYSHILTINVGKESHQAVIRDLHRHPAKPTIVHIDFQRVSATQKIHVQVPLHFVGEDQAPGVKVGGGLVSHLMASIDIACLPKDLPEFIEVDLSELELGHSVHLSDLKVAAGVEIVELSHGAEHDLPVASIHGRGGSAVEEEEAAEEKAEEGTAAPSED